MNPPNPFLALAAPGIAGLTPYVPGKPVSELERELGITESVKLASNENPLGPSPRVVRAIRDQRRALARRHGVDPAAITLGNGSNDVLDMVARTFLAPGLEAVFSQHAFAVYPICTQAVGATARVAPAGDGTAPAAVEDVGGAAAVGLDRRGDHVARTQLGGEGPVLGFLRCFHRSFPHVGQDRDPRFGG